MLTVRDHMTLTLAGQRFKHSGERATTIRHVLSYSEPQFARAYLALLDRADAELEHPQLVRRLRRLRDQRRDQRRAARAS